MLLSPRPTPVLPSSPMGEYTAINKVDRATYIPRATGNSVHSPRSITIDVTPPTMLPKSSTLAGTPRRPSPKRATSGHKSTAELYRAESATSVRSRGSTTSMNRSLSRESATSALRRSMSRESTPSKKPPKQFIVKSKATKVLHRRPSSSSTLARTPSYGKVAPLTGLLPLTQTDFPKRERRKTDSMQPSDRPALLTRNFIRQKALALDLQGGGPSAPLIRRTLSDGSSIPSF